MGLIRAAKGAIGSTLGDQWKEYFYCDALEGNVLVVNGQKRTSGHSSNRAGSENIITSGSHVAVANGQAMLIVEQGKVVEFSAEPGVFVFDASTEPSIFNGDLKEGILKTFETIGKRFVFGGETPNDQRVYYINTKEVQGNKFGTPNPIPFRIVDKNIGLDIDLSVRANGQFSYKIEDPILFYTNVTGNVAFEYTREDLDNTLRSEFLSALQPAFAKISAMGIRYSELPGHTLALSKAMNEVLSEDWRELRGISIVAVSINSVTVPPEDEELVKRLQKDAVYRNAAMAGATMVGAQADAMRDAAKNEAGAMTGYLGMGMAQQAGGMNAADFYKMAEAEKMSQGSTTSPKSSWICSECSTENTGNFCTNCGNKKPQGGAKFCGNCGAKVEKADAKFCPECGNKF